MVVVRLMRLEGVRGVSPVGLLFDIWGIVWEYITCVFLCLPAEI